MTDLPSCDGQPARPALSVVVPAYNEAARISASLTGLCRFLASRAQTWEMLVVDDGSTDGTADAVQNHAEQHPEVRLLRYETNRGKGHAVRYGILRARGDQVLFSDADLATPIDELGKLEEAIASGHDIAIGSRDIAGARLERRQSMVRELGGKLFNRCVQAIAVPGIHDTQCGFKLFTQDAAQRVFALCKIDNFSFDVEVLYVARRLGLNIAEVPVRWSHQEGSKVRLWRDAPRMLKTLWKIRTSDYRIDTPRLARHRSE